MKPYFETENGKLYHGDCLDVLRCFDEKSFDLIIADPPYGIDYQSSRRSDKTKRHDKIKNDKTPFIWWLFDAYRVLKEASCIICFCRWDVQEAFRLAMDWAGFCVKSQIMWDRVVHGMGDLAGCPAPQHDVMWFGVKGEYKLPGKRPTSVYKNMRVPAEKMVHPNEKPVALLIDLITSLSKVGDIVLDPFAGSGSTAVACEGVGRRWVSIDVDASIAARRIEAETKQLKLF